MRIFNTIIILLLTITTQAQLMTAEEVVQANLDAYNTHDINNFVSYFSEDITLVNFADGSVTANSKNAVREIYDPYFKASPNLHSKILKRTVFGNKVIDHEYITGRYGNEEALELVLIYEVKDQKINKITVLREK